jgi:hypothetical protein
MGRIGSDGGPPAAIHDPERFEPGRAPVVREDLDGITRRRLELKAGDQNGCLCPGEVDSMEATREALKKRPWRRSSAVP